MLRPKVGDLVRLKPLVVSSSSANDENPAIQYFGTKRSDDYEFFVYVDMVEEILPRPLAVGDRVRHLRASECRGTIVAILDLDAFIDWDATPYAPRGTALNARDRISELVRIEPT